MQEEKMRLGQSGRKRGDFDMETQNMVLNTKKLLGQETDSRSQSIRPIYFFNQLLFCLLLKRDLGKPCARGVVGNLHKRKVRTQGYVNPWEV